jgi:predicted ATP-binding protein involved in virulence
MYIQKAEITNIKSIEHFEIEFPNPAGWHVLIGDNGSGKSTIVKATALALVGFDEIRGLRINKEDWINKQSNSGTIRLEAYIDKELDSFREPENIFSEVEGFQSLPILGVSEISLNKGNLDSSLSQAVGTRRTIALEYKAEGVFSVAFGPYRRFEGGSSEWDDVYDSPGLANLAAHLSVFDESVALTEPIKWLKTLDYESLRDKPESKQTLENLKNLINSEDFLPHNSKLEKIGSDGVFFKDANGLIIAVNQMSDGYRSILSLTFELIRQLVRVYGSEKVFKNIEKGEMFIDLPGVVLIDEIDAHLHPTWQTRIGQWFLQYFPQLQFIVTTHSPLVCRACEKGSIWRLAAPGSDEESGEVTSIDRDRLIYGNILDAYGTEVFGTNIAISTASVEKQEELVKLGKKKMAGVINKSEEKELNKLRKTFTTDDPIDL